jgi:hypothetical protein
MCTTAVRFKYYFAWLLADAIVNNAGLGFNGFDSDGSPKWDLFTNIYVIPFEVSTTNICWSLNKGPFARHVWEIRQANRLSVDQPIKRKKVKKGSTEI